VGPQSHSLPIAEPEANPKPGYGLERALADSRLAHLWVIQKCRSGALNCCVFGALWTFSSERATTLSILRNILHLSDEC